MSLRFDLPTLEQEHLPWWEAAQLGKLLFQRCDACSTAFLYPRPFCPKCWATDVRWEQASGEATLYTWSVVHSNDLPPFRARVPYVAALVDLAEGPRLMTNLVDCAPDDLIVGQPVELVWHQDPEAGDAAGMTGPLALPCFRPTA
jgi:uncharacterized OB-fold protein